MSNRKLFSLLIILVTFFGVLAVAGWLVMISIHSKVSNVHLVENFFFEGSGGATSPAASTIAVADTMVVTKQPALYSAHPFISISDKFAPVQEIIITATDTTDTSATSSFEGTISQIQQPGSDASTTDTTSDASSTPVTTATSTTGTVDTNSSSTATTTPPFSQQ